MIEFLSSITIMQIFRVFASGTGLLCLICFSNIDGMPFKPEAIRKKYQHTPIPYILISFCVVSLIIGLLSFIYGANCLLIDIPLIQTLIQTIG